MNWIQISLKATDAQQVEPLEDALLAAGALSVTLSDAADQPLLEPGPGETPLWRETIVTGLFDAAEDPDAIAARLRAILQTDDLPSLRAEPLEARDWTRAWMDDFQPLSFGQRLWIVPDGFETPEPDAINLRIDPGLAFGTGTHPTTALCLEWLDAHDLNGLHIIDYGCGSGVLAIAALLLGARMACCVDNDPQAIQATRDNALKNAVNDRLRAFLTHEASCQPADIVLANILAGPLQQLAPALAGLTRPGGQLVLSGILANQTAELTNVYEHWFDMRPPVIRDDWVRLEGVRR